MSSLIDAIKRANKVEKTRDMKEADFDGLYIKSLADLATVIDMILNKGNFVDSRIYLDNAVTYTAVLDGAWLQDDASWLFGDNKLAGNNKHGKMHVYLRAVIAEAVTAALAGRLNKVNQLVNVSEINTMRDVYGTYVYYINRHGEELNKLGLYEKARKVAEMIINNKDNISIDNQDQLEVIIDQVKDSIRTKIYGSALYSRAKHHMNGIIVALRKADFDQAEEMATKARRDNSEINIVFADLVVEQAAEELQGVSEENGIYYSIGNLDSWIGSYDALNLMVNNPDAVRKIVYLNFVIRMVSNSFIPREKALLRKINSQISAGNYKEANKILGELETVQGARNVFTDPSKIKVEVEHSGMINVYVSGAYGFTFNITQYIDINTGSINMNAFGRDYSPDFSTAGGNFKAYLYTLGRILNNSKAGLTEELNTYYRGYNWFVMKPHIDELKVQAMDQDKKNKDQHQAKIEEVSDNGKRGMELLHQGEFSQAAKLLSKATTVLGQYQQVLAKDSQVRGKLFELILKGRTDSDGKMVSVLAGLNLEDISEKDAESLLLIMNLLQEGVLSLEEIAQEAEVLGLYALVDLICNGNSQQSVFETISKEFMPKERLESVLTEISSQYSEQDLEEDSRLKALVVYAEARETAFNAVLSDNADSFAEAMDNMKNAHIMIRKSALAIDDLERGELANVTGEQKDYVYSSKLWDDIDGNILFEQVTWEKLEGDNGDMYRTLAENLFDARNTIYSLQLSGQTYVDGSVTVKAYYETYTDGQPGREEVAVLTERDGAVENVEYFRDGKIFAQVKAAAESKMLLPLAAALDVGLKMFNADMNISRQKIELQYQAEDRGKDLAVEMLKLERIYNRHGLNNYFTMADVYLAGGVYDMAGGILQSLNTDLIGRQFQKAVIYSWDEAKADVMAVILNPAESNETAYSNAMVQFGWFKTEKSVSLSPSPPTLSQNSVARSAIPKVNTTPTFCINFLNRFPNVGAFSSQISSP